jgi:membrane protease YdiL (CAAX protease family)
MNVPLIKKGWLRALIFLGIWILIQAGLMNLLVKLLEPLTIANGRPDELRRLLVVYGTGFFINIPSVFIFRRLIDRKTIVSLGFGWKGFSRDAGTGLLTALFIIGLGTLILVLLKNVQFFDFQFNIINIAIYVLIMLLIAFSEEIVIRGYLLNNLLDSFPKWIALVISATVFALLHLLNPGFTWLSLVGIFAGGILLGINYIYTRNLWFGIFLHFAWNFLQGPILGYRVSGLEMDSMLTPTIHGPAWLTGGNFGFESSLLGSMLVYAVIVVLQFRYRRIKQFQSVDG